jgi:phospholipase D1/2
MRAGKDAAVPAASDPAGSAGSAIVVPGRNCWRVNRADAFYCIQDAAEYFRLLRLALLAARHSVLILGWDISATLNLLPDDENPRPSAPVRLDQLLAFIVRRNKHLRCDILIWDYASLYTLERDPLARLRLGWWTPRRVRFGYDDRHPIGGSHHQKIVVIDDRLAFCGSIDLTTHRWDTSAHRIEEPHRLARFRAPYGPYHEVHAMLEGPAAASLGDLARDRWRALGDTRIRRPASRSDSIWPKDVTPDLRNVEVAIARTLPGGGDEPATLEVEALFVDAIAAARRSIYIESQYFTSTVIAKPLAARLAEADGPEVVIVTPHECHGWLEQSTMGLLRESVFAHLRAADRHGRLRIVFPVASQRQQVSTFVHSKVMIVDDTLLRIGSANCAHRSLGLDTECDVAVDAAGSRDVSAGIRAIRARLLAEHLGADPERIAADLAQGSMVASIDRHGSGDRTLVPVVPPPAAIPVSDDTSLETIRAAADPHEPLGFGPAVERFMPWVDATAGPGPLRVWILPLCVLAAAGILVWSTSGGLHRPEFHAVQHLLSAAPADRRQLAIGLAAFVIAAVALAPIELLILAAGVFFGGVTGGMLAFAGSVLSSIAGYGVGRSVGEARLPHWMSRRSYRSTRQATTHGPLAIALLYASAPTSAGAIHRACGAARVPFAGFLAGSLIALVPTVAVISGLGALFRELLLRPSMWHGMLTIGGALILIGAASLARMVLLIRQFRPAAARQQSRAEFG